MTDSTTESTPTERDRSCEDRIEEHMSSREEQFRALFDPDSLDDHDAIVAALDAGWVPDDDSDMDEDGHGQFEVPSDKRVAEAVREELAPTEDMRFGSMWEDRINTVGELARDFLRDYASEDGIHDAVLGVDTKTTMRIQLSTGGPGDWIEAEIERGRHGWEIAGDVTYHFNDWFDHAERRVHGGPLEALAEYFVQIVGVGE